MAKRKRRPDTDQPASKGVQLSSLLPDVAGPKEKPATTKQKSQDKLAGRLKALKVRAKEDGVKVPDEFWDKISKKETHGAIKRAWRDLLRAQGA